MVQNGRIPYRSGTIGGHAFAIVGYTEDGFWVQNSWGASWGDNGLALWAYEDWLENVQDAARPEKIGAGLFRRGPRRAEIVGHFVHIDDGSFDDTG